MRRGNKEPKTARAARLRQARIAAGFETAKHASDLMGMPQPTYNTHETGSRDFDVDDAQRYAQFFGVSAAWLLTGEKAVATDALAAPLRRPAIRPIHVIDYVQAGLWSEVADPYPEGAGMATISADQPVSPRAFALEIKGRSMVPEFREGDRVIIEPALALDARPGDFVVAKLDADDTATFKKFRDGGLDRKRRPIIHLDALNPDFATQTIDAENPGRIVGIMIEHHRYRRR